MGACTRRWWLTIAVFTVGCAEAFGQTDGFEQKMQAGCPTEEACRALQVEARARLQTCQPNTIGYVRCADARADAVVVDGYVARWKRFRHQKSEQAEQKRRAEREAAAEQAIEDRKQREEQRVQQRERAEWILLDLPGCSQGDPRRCAEIEQFVRGHAESERLDEAATALRAGRAAIAKTEQEQAELARREAEDAAKRPRAKPLQAAPGPAPAASPPTNSCGGTIRCCDGSCSPTCTTVHRGCCSHHGGVCGG
jgi:hypothetical protein